MLLRCSSSFPTLCFSISSCILFNQFCNLHFLYILCTPFKQIHVKGRCRDSAASRNELFVINFNNWKSLVLSQWAVCGAAVALIPAENASGLKNNVTIPELFKASLTLLLKFVSVTFYCCAYSKYVMIVSFIGISSVANFIVAWSENSNN